MKICFCLSWYFPDSIGGTETYVHSLAVDLRNRGYEVSILKPGGEDETSYRYENIEVHSFFPGVNFSRQMYLGLKSSDLGNFEKKLKKIGPDIVHFHSLTGPAGISLFHIEKARQLTSKLFFTFHLPHLTCATSTFRHLKKNECDGVADPLKCSSCLYVHSGWPIPAAKIAGRFSTAMKDRQVKLLGQNAVLTRVGVAELVQLRKDQLHHLSNLCTKLICLSSWFQQVLKQNGVKAEKLAFIEQGLLIDKTGFSKTKKVATSHAGPIRLVFIGRLNAIKGISLLLPVMEQFGKADFVLDLFGPVEDSYLQQLKQFLDKGNTRYKGLLKREEILPTLNQYDAIIVPSLVTEMAPLVLQEAFAAGIPAIASDVAGNAAFVKPNQNGWLFESGDSESLKAVLSSLLKNRNELAEIRDKILPVRTIDNIVSEHLQLYLA